MSRVGVRELARKIGITENALRKAIYEGRITTDSYAKNKRGVYEFDEEAAVFEYESNTSRALSSNSRFDEDEEETDLDSQIKKKSVLDKDPKTWSYNDAIQARAIYAALKAKHEMEVTQGKFYEKAEADREFLRIATTFARGLVAIPSKIKQKIPDITDKQMGFIKDICELLAKECEKKL